MQKLPCGAGPTRSDRAGGRDREVIENAGFAGVSPAVNERRACAVTPQGVVDCWADGGNTAAPSWAEGPDGVFYEVIR